MKSFVLKAWNLFKSAYQHWREGNAPRLAASLAYYTIFSMAPMLVIVIAVTGLIWQANEVEAQVLNQIRDLVGEEGARFVGELIRGAGNRAQGVLATIIGVVTLLFGALGVFNELQSSLNTLWDVKVQKAQGFWPAIKEIIFDRFLSFTMILGIGFLLLVSLVISAALSAAQQVVGNALPLSELIWQLINLLVSIGVITVLFALMYKYLPDAEVAWRDVWLGAAVTAGLFSLGKTLIGLYLGNSAIASTFGAAGSLVLLLVWVYYSAQILFFGAEFIEVYANTYGTKIRPEGSATIGAKPASQAYSSPSGQPAPVLAAPTYAVPGEYVSTSGARQAAQVVLGLMTASFMAGIAAMLLGFRTIVPRRLKSKRSKRRA